MSYEQLRNIAPSKSSSGLGMPASEPLFLPQRVFRRQLGDSISRYLFPCHIVYCHVYILYFSAFDDIEFPVFIDCSLPFNKRTTGPN